MTAGFQRARRLDDALHALAVGPRRVLAGCTDIYPSNVGRELGGRLLDVTGIDELYGIESDRDTVRIGALTSWTQVREATLPPGLEALRQAAAEVGARQIQNVASIGGNLCNASPAADGAPPLLALDAEVELARLDGRRRLPLSAFLLGNRHTALADDELLVAIHVPRRGAAARSHFIKLGARHYLVISIVMTAVLLEHDADGSVCHAGIAVGACAPTARRLPEAEQALHGAALDSDLAGRLLPAHLAPLAPIDDVRASAAYRREVTLELVRRCVSAAARGGD